MVSNGPHTVCTLQSCFLFCKSPKSTENATVVVSHDPGCSKAISKLVNNRKLASTM